MPIHLAAREKLLSYASHNSARNEYREKKKYMNWHILQIRMWLPTAQRYIDAIRMCLPLLTLGRCYRFGQILQPISWRYIGNGSANIIILLHSILIKNEELHYSTDSWSTHEREFWKFAKRVCTCKSIWVTRTWNLFSWAPTENKRKKKNSHFKNSATFIPPMVKPHLKASTLLLNFYFFPHFVSLISEM